jgi:hypothetical protein
MSAIEIFRQLRNRKPSSEGRYENRQRHEEAKPQGPVHVIRPRCPISASRFISILLPHQRVIPEAHEPLDGNPMP